MQNHKKNLECDRITSPQKINKPCRHCEGQGYISIRDCSGEIQREENCSFCNGSGNLEPNIGEASNAISR
jgi:DnaJ-class molecular chaperone